MKKEKNNVLLIVVLVVLVMVILFGGGVLLLFNLGYVEFKSNINNDSITDMNGDDSKEITTYKLGDKIKLTQLENVEEYGNDYDYSDWMVLEDAGAYIKLFYVGDSVFFGKSSPLSINSEMLSREQKILEKYEIDFGVLGNVDLLNEADLKLLGCDIETLKCEKTVDWLVDGSFTKVFLSLNEVISLSGYEDGKLRIISSSDGYTLDSLLAFTSPTITVLKSNIK